MLRPPNEMIQRAMAAPAAGAQTPPCSSCWPQSPHTPVWLQLLTPNSLMPVSPEAGISALQHSGTWDSEISWKDSWGFDKKLGQTLVIRSSTQSDKHTDQPWISENHPLSVCSPHGSSPTLFLNKHCSPTDPVQVSQILMFLVSPFLLVTKSRLVLSKAVPVVS